MCFHGFSRAKFWAKSAAKSPPCLSCFMRIALWTQDLSGNKLRDNKSHGLLTMTFPIATQPFWDIPLGQSNSVKPSKLPNLPVLQLATHAICQHLHGRMLQDGGLAQLEEVRHLGLKVSLGNRSWKYLSLLRDSKVKVRCLWSDSPFLDWVHGKRNVKSSWWGDVWVSCVF